MRSWRTAALVGMLLCFFIASASAQQADINTEVLAYVSRQSQVWYDTCVRTHGAIAPGTWQEPLESAFLKLARYSGQPGFTITYAVLSDTDFNAACFPGGQFIINHGALQLLDQIIESEIGAALSDIPADKLSTYREMLIAPVIAHELGHYYCRHVYAAMKARWSSTELNQDNIEIRMIKFTQDNELEADQTGYLLLKRAGYDPDLMIHLLEILNSIQQQQLSQAPLAAFNWYLDSHPSPHRRLAAFQNEKQKLHQWASDMEHAFSEVQLGRNLDQALAMIESGLTLVPANLFLLRERAIIYHKQWLQTVSLRNQELRAIIDSPSFRDDMVFSTLYSRGVGKVIPGDKNLYLKAREAYAATYDKSEDPGFYSNFAVLLAYSPVAADEKAAVALAYAATKADGSLTNVCNLATALYLTNQKEQAFTLIANLAVEYDKKYSEFLSAAEASPEVLGSLQSLHQQIAMTQALNPAYVYNDFTPLLNLALCLAATGQKEKAKAVAADYIARYESTSAWARYLANATGADLRTPVARKPMDVQGIHVGSSLEEVLGKWGKATEISVMKNGDEVWAYAPLSTLLGIRDGALYSIELDSATSPRVADRFGVGSSRSDIEKVVGSQKRTANNNAIYEGSQNLAVFYVNNVAQQIVLFP